MKLLEWMNVKTNQVKDFVDTSVPQFQLKVTKTISQIKYAANYVYYSLDFKHYLLNGFIKGWQGFSRFIDPSIMMVFVDSAPSRNFLRQITSTNLVKYLGSILLYEVAIKGFMHYMIPMSKDSYAETAMNTAAFFYFLSLSLQKAVDNRIYNVCAGKVAAHNKLDEYYQQICPDGEISAKQADIASAFYFGGNLLMAKFISSSFVGGRYLAMPLRALGYGEMFAEYNLSKMCTRHRHEVLAANKFYSFGLGLSFLAVYKLSRLAVEHFVGVTNDFVDDALFAFVFQYFIFLATTNDKPLPLDEKGIDVFYHSRMVVESILKETANTLYAQFNKPGTNIDLEEIKKKLLAFPPVNFFVDQLLPEDFQNLNKFRDRPSVQFFLELYGKNIVDFCNGVIAYREATYIKLLPAFLIPKKKERILKIILAEWLEGVPQAVIRFVQGARNNIISQSSVNKKELANALEEWEDLHQPFIDPQIQNEISKEKMDMWREAFSSKKSNLNRNNLFAEQPKVVNTAVGSFDYLEKNVTEQRHIKL